MNSILSLPDAAAWALRTSLEALPLVLAVLLLAHTRLCQPRWRMWIAALFFIRLALPAVPEAAWNSWSIRSTAIVPASASASPSPSPSAPIAAAHTESEVASELAPALASPPQPAAFNWFALLPWIWLAGVLVTLAWLAASHLLTRRWILRNQQPSLRWFDSLAAWARDRQGVKQPVPVVIVRGLSTMAIFGWVRPRLLIPADLSDRYTPDQIRGMLLHEFAHVRRGDVLWTWLALLACALHWFNPLAWLAFRRFCADRELICDAAALANLGDEGRFSYGDALLRSLHVTPLTPAPSLAPFFRIHPEIKHRILMITKPIAPNAWSRLAALLLLPALSLISFTTSRAQSEGEKPAREGERSKSESREGERESAAKKESAPRESELDKYKRENAERKATRDGEGKREGARDGEMKKEGARDGERSREGTRDGDSKREGARDGDSKKEGARDGERSREGTRDGDSKREGARDGDGKREGARDGERSREGTRDGEGKREGARDGDSKKEGARDGEKPRREGDRDGDSRRTGPRDGETKKEGPRDGEAKREGARDGERSREGARDGDGDGKRGSRED